VSLQNLSDLLHLHCGTASQIISGLKIASRKQDNIGVAPLKGKGKLVSQSKEKAQILIKQFSSVFTRGSIDNMPEHCKLTSQKQHMRRSSRTFQH
jgi:methyl coenzyme M reductase subunit C-like uncharacterized protein (methanogenesis marker protein 7)